ncbi:MAG: ribbon-helix-helix protein, CopG family [Alphaproteobacteria bacterium]|nr:ribbon-helix-helix protein, CopG family [Alphaproteobacteria bacterium]
MRTHLTSVRLPTDTLAKLDRLAAALDRTRSWVIGEAVSRYVDYEEWFAAAVAEGTEAADRGDVVPHAQAIKRLRRKIASVRPR